MPLLLWPSLHVAYCRYPQDIMGLLEQGLFLHEHGLDSAIGGKASEATVLLAGMSGEIASHTVQQRS